MHLSVRHSTHYSYSQPVDYGLQKVRLQPLESSTQKVLDWSLELVGCKREASYTDHFGNHVDLVSIIPGEETLSIIAQGTVETLNSSGVLGPVYGRAPLWLFLQPTPLTMPGPGIKALAGAFGSAGNALDGLHALSARILELAPYMTGVTHPRTTAENALQGKLGVCQDHAQIFVAAARLVGIPARYVSGYLMVNEQVDQDASHAWAEAHIDGLGWVGFDVSNGVSPDEKYIRVAIGRDARDAAPIEGMRFGAADETLIVTLQVQQ